MLVENIFTMKNSALHFTDWFDSKISGVEVKFFSKIHTCGTPKIQQFWQCGMENEVWSTPPLALLTSSLPIFKRRFLLQIVRQRLEKRFVTSVVFNGLIMLKNSKSFKIDYGKVKYKRIKGGLPMAKSQYLLLLTRHIFKVIEHEVHGRSS